MVHLGAKKLSIIVFGLMLLSSQDVRAMDDFPVQKPVRNNDGFGANLALPITRCKPCKEGLTPLMQAIVGEKSLEEIVNLLEKCDLNEINACNYYKYTALHYAVNHGNPKVVEALIKKGAKVNKPGNSGWTSLHGAVCRAPKETKQAIVKLLLNNGADPNMVDSDDETSVFKAVECNALEVLQLFFDGPIKPDLTIKPKYREHSWVFYAICEGSLPVVKFLAEHGAGVDEQIAIDGKSYSLAEWAEKYRKEHEIANYLKSLKTKQVKQSNSNVLAVVPFVAGLQGVGGIKKLEK